METTIQISKSLLNELKKRKLGDKESYENVIWDLLEDSMEISEETKKDLEESRKEFEQGKVKTLAQVKKELKL
ncbi:hypothetical protein HYX18_02175 [Candidatus Woesearchaeota archaeon]|nr:hypothetical protein [Candidatus Woesearchaeota archaeon]